VEKKDSLRGWKKALAKLASKLKKLLANSKFHSHLASWRVVISTPVKKIKTQRLQCFLFLSFSTSATWWQQMTKT
jgi:hypothetical protein